MKEIDIDATEAYGQLNAMEFDRALPKADRRKLIREAQKPLKKAVQSAYRAGVNSDPRKSYLGVKTTVYKDAMGGTVSLYNPRGASSARASIVRTGGKSGIRRRRARSKRTEEVDSYWGRDRAFILRFQNLGTTTRTAFTRTSGGKPANRGTLRARGFFRVGVNSVSAQVGDAVKDCVKERITLAGNKSHPR